MTVYVLIGTYLDPIASDDANWPMFADEIEAIYATEEAARKAAKEMGLKHQPQASGAPYFRVEAMKVKS